MSVTRRVGAGSLRPRNVRSAGSSPTRASWLGKTPRVSSRSASNAVFVLATSGSSPDVSPAATADELEVELLGSVAAPDDLRSVRDRVEAADGTLSLEDDELRLRLPVVESAAD